MGRLPLKIAYVIQSYLPLSIQPDTTSNMGNVNNAAATLTHPQRRTKLKGRNSAHHVSTPAIACSAGGLDTSAWYRFAGLSPSHASDIS